MHRHRSTQPASYLDDRLRETGQPVRFVPPVRGWLRAIREALGMTAEQLGRRLGIKQPSVVALEQSEARGAISLATLRRAAEAMDCTLVYALVPNRSLEATLRERALLYARRRMQPVEHSMLLEDQAVPAQDEDALIDRILDEVNPRRLWDDD